MGVVATSENPTLPSVCAAKQVTDARVPLGDAVTCRELTCTPGGCLRVPPFFLSL